MLWVVAVVRKIWGLGRFGIALTRILVELAEDIKM